jgi:hypothetical protein
MVVSSVVIATSLNKKLARSRGENLIHAVPPELPFDEGVSWTDNEVIRSSYLRIAFRLTLAGGFRWLFLEETLNL